MGRGQVLHAAAQADGRCHQGTEAGISRGPLPPEGRPGPDQRQAWARPVGSLGKGSGAPQNTDPACSPSLRQRELEAWGSRPGSITSLSLPDNDHSADHWLNDPLTFAH